MDLLKEYFKSKKQFIDYMKENVNKYDGKQVLGFWRIEDVLRHLLGWDMYYLNQLESIKSGKEPKSYGKINDFNALSVEKYNSLNFNELIKRLEEINEDFKDKYLSSKWADSFLKTLSHHYLKHLKQFQKNE